MPPRPQYTDQAYVKKKDEYDCMRQITALFQAEFPEVLGTSWFSLIFSASGWSRDKSLGCYEKLRS